MTVGGRTFTPADQARHSRPHQAGQYLSTHRGGYAERNGLFLPIVKRLDLSVSKNVFRSVSVVVTRADPLDITNFGNLFNTSGARTAGREYPDTYEPERRCNRSADLQPSDAQRQPDHESAANVRRYRGRVRDDAQLQVQLQLDTCNAEC